MTPSEIFEAQNLIDRLGYLKKDLENLGLPTSQLYMSIIDIETALEIERRSPSKEVLDYYGWLQLRDMNSDSTNLLYLSTLNIPLAEELENKISGKTVTVRYWTTDKQVTRNEAIKAFNEKLMGKVDCDFGAHYSEMTGYLFTDEEVNVGGHDLIERLRSYVGKFLILEIELHVPPGRKKKLK